MATANSDMMDPAATRPAVSDDGLPAVSGNEVGAANRLAHYQRRVRRFISDFLPAADEPPSELHAAMRYAVLGKAKHLRPMLTYATGEALGIAPDDLDAFAAAVELVHAFSLVHDDLPAMDDDDLRRGEPAVHIAYGEATAILAGDALQIAAFQLLGTDHRLSRQPQMQTHAIDILAKAAGSTGMTGGQVMDIAAEGRRISLSELDTMYRKKTGQLIRASVAMPCVWVQRTDRHAVRHLLSFADCIGLAFQIRDDLIECVSTETVTGKPADSDRANGKATYPLLLGLSRARQRAAELYDQAISHLDSLRQDASLLRHLAGFVVRRRG